jgi:hypothetical protein
MSSEQRATCDAYLARMGDRQYFTVREVAD